MSISFDKSKVRILVVDDEDSIRTMLITTLTEGGWSVEGAENGKKAQEKLAASRFHIVLSDIQMPEVTGSELLEFVKANYPAIEFVMMTSNATFETALKAIKFGAYDYLTKPFDDLGIVVKKMEQVAEKILLRQQNQELLRRLKKAGQDLKNLFDFSSELNGILDEEVLVATTLKYLPQLFQDPSVKAGWFRKEKDVWKSIKQIPGEKTFQTSADLTELETLLDQVPDARNLEIIELDHADKPGQALVLESLQANLTDLVEGELRTCFTKVMFHQDIVSLANRDGLTRLYNHRYFQDRLRQELAQVKRQHGTLSLLLLDVDHFKHYNDTQGHPAGDSLLRTLAGLIDQSSIRRETDIVARYGGEEFVLILPFTNLEGAMNVAERIRAMVEKFEFDHRENQPLGCISISIGVANFPTHADQATSLIESADKALYRAKSEGRNRVFSFIKEGQATAASEVPKATLADVLDTHTGAQVIPKDLEPPALEVVFPSEPAKVATPELPSASNEPLSPDDLARKISELVDSSTAPSVNLNPVTTVAKTAEVKDLLSTIEKAYSRAGPAETTPSAENLASEEAILSALNRKQNG